MHRTVSPTQLGFGLGNIWSTSLQPVKIDLDRERRNGINDVREDLTGTVRTGSRVEDVGVDDRGAGRDCSTRQ